MNVQYNPLTRTQIGVRGDKMDILDRPELACISGYLFAVASAITIPISIMYILNTTENSLLAAIVMLLLVVVFSLAFIKISQLIYGKNKAKVLIGVVK